MNRVHSLHYRPATVMPRKNQAGNERFMTNKNYENRKFAGSLQFEIVRRDFFYEHGIKELTFG